VLYLCTGVGLFFEREMHDGSYFPVIKDITQKGSAYREGTIKTSEILLSVDGKSCREMSLNELKGVVRTASVTLFVCLWQASLSMFACVCVLCVFGMVANPSPLCVWCDWKDKLLAARGPLVQKT